MCVYLILTCVLIHNEVNMNFSILGPVFKQPMSLWWTIIRMLSLQTHRHTHEHTDTHTYTISSSKPSTYPKENMIARPEIEHDLAMMFLPEPVEADIMRFRIVLGPSGSGKTSTVRQLCNLHPQGMLYYEISEPDTFISTLKS